MTYAPGPDQEAVVAAIQAHAQALALPEWPVFTLANPDRPGFLAGTSQDGSGSLLRLRLDHRPPGGIERLIVQTQPRRPEPADLTAVLVAVRSADDEGTPLRLDGPGRSGIGAEAVVDGRPVAAVVHREGEATAWSVTLPEVTVVVAARRVALDDLALTTVTDLGPFRAERTVVVARFLNRG